MVLMREAPALESARADDGNYPTESVECGRTRVSGYFVYSFRK